MLGDPSKGFLQNAAAQKQTVALHPGLVDGGEAKQAEKPLGYYFRRDAAEQAQSDATAGGAGDMLRGSSKAAHRMELSGGISPVKSALGHYFSGESVTGEVRVRKASNHDWDVFRPRPVDTDSRLPFAAMRR